MFDRGDPRQSIEAMASGMGVNLDPVELDRAFHWRDELKRPGARFAPVASSGPPQDGPMDFAAEEQAYQALQNGNAPQPEAPAAPEAESDGWRLPTVFTDAAGKGVAGILGLPVDAATAGINALLPEEYEIDPSKTVGGSASIKHLMDLPARAMG